LADIEEKGDLALQRGEIATEMRVHELAAHMTVEGGETAGCRTSLLHVKTALEKLQYHEGMLEVPGAFLDGTAAHGSDGALQVFDQQVVQDHDQASGRSLMHGSPAVVQFGGVPGH
jgi:hypothetical protein